MRAFVLWAALALPAAAQAGCPVAGDLSRGIEVVFADEETERHYAWPDGGTRVVWTEDGEVSTDLVAPSGLPRAYWNGSGAKPPPDASRRFYDDQSARRAPKPGTTARFAVREVGADGAEERLTVTVRWAAAAASRDWAGCTYRTLAGTVTEDWADGAPAWEMHVDHIPALGITVLRGGGDAGTSIDRVPVMAFAPIL